MRKRLLPIIAAVFLALLVLPVAITQLTQQPETRARPELHLADMEYEEVHFTNSAQSIGLAAMLFVPKGEPPYPAVVIIHGSGPSRRASPWYLTYASYLQDQGIAVLLPDKRGSEESEGQWQTSSLEDLATDTVSAVSYLRSQDPTSYSAIGVLGVSQGGEIAPIVAAGSSDVSFVIDVVGGAVPKHDELLYEENNNLREMGFLPGFSNAIAYLSTLWLRNFSQRDFWSAVGNFDPLEYWREVDVPALVVYGERDTNVPSGESRDRLNALGKSNIRVVVFEESGHNLEAPTGIGGDYIREDALALICDFIRNAAQTP